MEKQSPVVSTNRLDGGLQMPKLKRTNTVVGKRSGKTKLHFAAIKNQPDEIQKSLLKRRTSTLTISRRETALDVNAQDELGRSALHWAATLGYGEFVKRLIEFADPKCTLTDADGRTPLHEAAIRGHKDIVEELLEKKKICDDTNTRDDCKLTALINTGDNCKRTALHWAAENGNEEVVQLLVKKGADVSKEDNNKDKALNRAARNGHKNIVQTLFKDARVTAADKAAVLHLAVDGGHRGTAIFLLQNKDFENEDVESAEVLAQKCRDDGNILLWWATKKGLMTVVKLLLDKNAKVDKDTKVNTMDDNGQSLLSWAASSGHEAVVKLLLEKGADVEAKGKSGRTALGEAAAGGHEAVVKLLLEKGANVEAKDESGRTALDRAATGGHKAVVKLLESFHRSLR